jgi:mannosyltransferase
MLQSQACSALPLLYFPTRRLFGPALALLANLLLALSPWHLYWSQNARFYTALLLLYMLGMFAFYYFMESNRLAWLFAASVFFLLATLERMTTLFFGPVAAVYLLILLVTPRFGRPKGLNARSLAIFAAPVVLFSVYLLFFTSFLGDSLATWIFGRSHNPLRVLLSVIYDLGLPLFLLGCWAALT